MVEKTVVKLNKILRALERAILVTLVFAGICEIFAAVVMLVHAEYLLFAALAGCIAVDAVLCLYFIKK